MTFNPDGQSQHGSGASQPFDAPTGYEPAATFASPATGATAPAASTPAGWYPDPTNPSVQRWWDGVSWTDHTTTDQGIQTATFQNATFQEPRRRGRRILTAVGSGAAVLVLLGLRFAGTDAFDSAVDLFTGGDTRELAQTAGADWQTVPVLGGTGTLAYDPSWGDASTIVDLQAYQDAMNEVSRVPLTVDAAWITDSNDDGTANILYVITTRALTGGTTPRLEGEAFIGDPLEGEENTAIVTDGTVRTSGGYGGYVAEFGYDLYGWHYVDSVGVVIEGRDEVLLWITSGSEELGSGVDDLEAVLNSLQIND